MFLLIDKKKGPTSHDVVDSVRKVTGQKKVGHGGTLDPKATGLLVVGVGRGSTKKLGEVAKGKNKTYIAEIFLGEERDSHDSEGNVIVSNPNFPAPTKEEINGLLESFLGKQKQVPPVFSALKVGGKKSYELARKGKGVSLEAREIEIFDIKLLEYDYPILKIEVVVSSGTYIRALARDMGRALGSGAYLKNLRRTKIGDISVDDAVSVEDLELEKDNWEKYAKENIL